MQFPDARIIVFAKAPVAGAVKTRLIPHYGPEFAMELHAAMLWHILHTLSTAKLCPLQLWCAPDQSHPYFAQCSEQFETSLHEQVGADLGQRMAHAFDKVLTKADHAVIVGADCPMLTAADIETALSILQTGSPNEKTNDTQPNKQNNTHKDKRAVIKPAKDGGYVMLGLNKIQRDLFKDIPWGTSEVYEKTTDKSAATGLNMHILEETWDVDEPVDVEQLKELAHQPSQTAFHPRLTNLLTKI